MVPIMSAGISELIIIPGKIESSRPSKMANLEIQVEGLSITIRKVVKAVYC